MTMTIESAGARNLPARWARRRRGNICKLSQGARRNSQHFSDLRMAFSRRQRSFSSCPTHDSALIVASSNVRDVICCSNMCCLHLRRLGVKREALWTSRAEIVRNRFKVERTSCKQGQSALSTREMVALTHLYLTSIRLLRLGTD